MSLSYWNDKSKEYDVAVIGGGIAGLSTVYWLQKLDPNLKIVLLERNYLASGATGRNAGFITCGSVEHFNRLVKLKGKEKALEQWKFSEENLRLLEEEIIKDNDSIEFEKKGSFSLASEPHEFDELKTSASLMKDMGINVEVLDEEGIKSRVGAVNFVGGIKYCDDASVNPVKLLNAIKDKCKNVDFLEATEVQSINAVGDNQHIITNRGTFSVMGVVMATNAYSPMLHDYFKDKIIPTRGQIMSFDKVDKFMEGPCYANFVLDYFRQLPNGRLIIGGFRQLNEDTKKNEVGYEDTVTDVIQDALCDFVHKYLPQYKDHKPTHQWAGIMGFSKDGNPLLGNLPDNPAVYFLGGFTAHGLGLSFHCGKKIAELVLEGKELPAWISAKRF